jgi:predicted RNA-binding protein (TIGR00451 family)
MNLESWEMLRKIRGIANYQFGGNIGDVLFPPEVKIVCSPSTKRIRHVYLNDNLLATLRPKDGLFALTIDGAQHILQKTRGEILFKVQVNDESIPFVRKGRNVFAKHVIDASPEIRPKSEVIVVDRSNTLLAVGKSALSGEEILAFQKGIAVKVRRGIDKKTTSH